MPRSLCSIDHEDFVLHDENNVLIIGSRRGDGRIKQIPLVTQRGRSSHSYTVLAEVNDRHTLSVFSLFCRIREKRPTYIYLDGSARTPETR
ncbi:hypothetical protein Y032_0094g2704 [Ancylostoma ceylanicum]|uniref:Uncharacterized protein n=1 Tax=Ancylostoma ceylanicum TaxID=53326 RepID=A0A016TK17_9BILA|nr:hypothetical protein Y032_0094g2704 [Ancylostoma ceylanicum]